MVTIFKQAASAQPRGAAFPPLNIMPAKKHYSEYTSDEVLINTYNAYQKKYRAKPRHSDLKTLQLVEQLAKGKKDFALLDVGCSTGNFLYHARKSFPSASLCGCDLADTSIQQCKGDPDLAGISFYRADLLSLLSLGKFDFVVINAVTYLLDMTLCKCAYKSICDVLKDGGSYVGFEFVNPHNVQELTVVETSVWNPHGLTMHIRSAGATKAMLLANRFNSVSFHPFTLPEDLPHPGFDADVMTYTKKDEFGERMAFRGALYQPWCHLVAKKV